MNSDILKESYDDIKNDFEELEYLTKSAIAQLNKFIIQIKKKKIYIRIESFNTSIEQSNKIEAQLSQILDKIKILANQARNTDYSDQILGRLTNSKDTIFQELRTIYSLTGGIITSTDWQSPSSSFSVYSEAGRQTGNIKNTLNDYKRDIHLDEEIYERAFLKEYIDSRFKFGIHMYMTSSGMSAFTTIFNFLLGERNLKGKILAGQSSYFQYKQLLSSMSGNRIIWCDETNTEKIIEAIEIYQPCVIFLDSLCNASSIPIPNLAYLIKYLTNHIKDHTYLVIDNTCLGPTYQLMQLVKGKSKKLHLIVFESLMKYHHFGLDRATGGIIYSWGKDTHKLRDYRKNSGTNIADSSVYLFPIPNRIMLEKRLERFQTNATYLATALSDHIKGGNNNKINHIIYPALPNHTVHDKNLNLSFTGSFFNIEFKEKSIKTYKKFLRLVIEEAKKKKVQIIVGTSFGLNHTRIYLTSLWTDQGEPFIRIAVGTENRRQIEQIKDVLISAINKI